MKQSSLIILAGIMALALGCAGDGNGNSSSLAPASISGVVVTDTVISGTGEFDSSGTSVTTFTSGTFDNVNSGETYSGTYVYTRTSRTSAILVQTATAPPTHAGGSISTTLTFTGEKDGTYSALGITGINGTQTGTFITN